MIATDTPTAVAPHDPFLAATDEAERVLFDPTVPEQFPLPTTQKYTKAEIQVLLDRAIAVHQTGKLPEAMELYREVLLHDRGNKQALYFTTIALSQQNQPEDKVLALMKHAVAGMPNVPEAHYNLGILFHRLGKEEESKPCFLKAITLLPALTEAKTSLGGCYLNLGDKDKGTAWLRAAATTGTEKADSVYSRAFARLTLGDLFNGWNDYDARWKTASFLVENRRDFGNARHWNGKPIPGKHLYIHTEQGAGDVIMFSRFIEEVARRSQAKTVTLEVGASLVDHLAQLRGVDYVIASNTAVPEEAGPVHFFLPYMGMMRKCGFFDYAKTPRPDGWLGVLPNFEVDLGASEQVVVSNSLKVGIAWAGSKAHKNDRYRSIPWAQWRDEVLTPLADTGKFRFFSFQVGDRARDIDDGGATLGVVDLTPQLKTFAHTAHALRQMDLILSVDTATIHAAASLVEGPHTHVLIPAAPDWRWLLDGSSTPWYSRMTLHRQAHSNDWSPALAALRNAALAAAITKEHA